MAGLQIFLGRMVPNLRAFAIEPPKGTEPHFSQQYDRWGGKITASRMDKDPQDLECNSSPNVFPGNTFWTSLLATLQPVETQLLHLSLPANWYSSTGRLFKPMPILRRFRRLKSLHLPKVAIICNPYARDYDKDNNVRHAVTFLPHGLEKLTLTQADTETCIWVQEGLCAKYLLPRLREVHLVFREDYWPILPSGFADDVREAGVRVFMQWKGRCTDV